MPCIKTECLPLADIKIDTACQARAAINATIIDEYAKIMKGRSDDTFPPVVVFHDGTDHWLSDGFHRHAAAEKAGLHSLKADIREGSRREAVLYAVGANVAHGLRRTNADKRRAVNILLEDEAWSTWSNRDISRRCGVDEGLVRKLRSVSADCPQIARKVERNGTVFDMKTGNIGKKDGLEELLSIRPDRDEQPEQGWFAAPETAAADDSTAEVTSDERMPTCDPARSSDEVQLRELMSAWARASEEVRHQFLVNVGALLSPQAEAGPALTEPELSPEPGPCEAAEPSSTEPQENQLFEIWKPLIGHSRWYGRRWVEVGCPDGPLPDEHWTFTEKLGSFRAAAIAATEDQRQQFLELSRAA
jgi:hypothetical protein